MHVEEEDTALDRIKAALESVLARGLRTVDIDSAAGEGAQGWNAGDGGRGGRCAVRSDE